MEHLSGTQFLYGRLMAIPTNVRPGLKGFLGTNALAYLPATSVKKKIKFCNIDTCGQFS
jgi:hypothetical protein